MNWYKFSKVKNIKFILVHGWEGSPEKDWFPWLSKELSKKGFQVLNLAMPSPFSPKKDKWVRHLTDHIKLSFNTVIIAHSIGCMCVLRYLEQIDKKIKAMILVAPFIENEQKYKTISSFFYGDINWKKIKNNCSKIYTLHSDNDPYVSVSQSVKIQEKLDSNYKILKNKGHFTSSDGVKKIPEIIKILKEELKI